MEPNKRGTLEWLNDRARKSGKATHESLDDVPAEEMESALGDLESDINNLLSSFLYGGPGGSASDQ